MEIIDGPAEVAVDHVPSADCSVPVASYRDWNAADTRVISCCIGNDLYAGERFESRDEALATIRKRHGQVLEANYVPGRAFFRVRRAS